MATEEKSKPTIDQLDWIAIPADLKNGSAYQSLSTGQIRLWVLVLRSQRIPCRVATENHQPQLMVPAEHFHAALEEINLFEKENRNWPPPPPLAIPFRKNQVTSLWVIIGMVIFHNISQHQLLLFGSGHIDWLMIGNADVGLIREGQWWRSVTALTLHSGNLHLLSNLVIGGILALRLCRTMGSGLGFFLIISAGSIGNILNALVQAPDHRSIGASTAVFGALGLLAVYNMLHYRSSLWRRWPLPLAAALGLFALLGVGGDNTDIGAHLFGFISGAALAVFFSRLPSVLPICRGSNLLSGAVAVLLIVGSWWLALRNSFP